MKDKIKIGLVIPLSGENKSLGESILKSVKLAVNDINDNKTELMVKLMIMAAVYEFMFMHKIPVKVVISEYLKASDFFVEVFGDIGRHARLALGAAELPLNAPIEIELIIEIK